MQLVLDILAIASLAMGLFFMLVGAVGVVRLPDVYHRLHAASKCSTLGLLGLVVAAMLHVGTLAVVTKSIAVIAFAFVAVPIGSHLLSKAAHRDKAPQWKGTLSDELANCEEDGACNADFDAEPADSPASKKKRKHSAA
ncbi:MAG: monovalent cation/H(+) antiporter subunit G [Phycisphaerales bacterium JB063]